MKFLYDLFRIRKKKVNNNLPRSTKKYEVAKCSYYFHKENREFKYGGVWHRHDSYKTLESAKQACRDLRNNNVYNMDLPVTRTLTRFKARKKIN